MDYILGYLYAHALSIRLQITQLDSSVVQCGHATPCPAQNQDFEILLVLWHAKISVQIKQHITNKVLLLVLVSFRRHPIHYQICIPFDFFLENL